MFKNMCFRDGEVSHSKTLVVASWIVATIWGSLLMYQGKFTIDFVEIYLGAFVLNAVGSAATSAYVRKGTIESKRRRDEE